MKNYIIVLLLLSSKVLAGDPGGISLLVKALPSASDYNYVFDGFFRNYYGVDNPHTPSCDQNDYTPYIDYVYLNTLPKGIDDNILIKSITDLSTRTQISKILSSYTDDQLSGFDGIMFYELRKDEIIIYTFDSRDSDKMCTTKIKVDNLISKSYLARQYATLLVQKYLHLRHNLMGGKRFSELVHRVIMVSRLFLSVRLIH